MPRRIGYAIRYERNEARRDSRAGHSERKLRIPKLDHARQLDFDPRSAPDRR